LHPISDAATLKFMDDTPVRLPVEVPGFSGPLDLLVQLIAKKDLDIFSISIAAITEDYIRIVRGMEPKDLDEAGDYLVLAATLVRYKARALLPREETALEEEEENQDHIREQRRQEYERFRQLAEELRRREEMNANLFPRLGPPPEGQGEVIEYTEVSVYDLYQTFQKIIQEIGASKPREIAGETYSVDEKMLELEALIAHNRRVVITEYLRSLRSKLEIIVVFLAMLEMIRLKEIKAVQDQIHGEIILEKGEKNLSDYTWDLEDGPEEMDELEFLDGPA